MVLQSLRDMTLDQARDIAKQYPAAGNRLSQAMAELFPGHETATTSRTCRP